jgi:hypothetical protein
MWVPATGADQLLSFFLICRNQDSVPQAGRQNPVALNRQEAEYAGWVDSPQTPGTYFSRIN